VTSHGIRGLLGRLKPNPKTAGYYFVAPIMLLLLVFMIYPIISSLLLSLQKFNLGEYRYVGLENYRTLLVDPSFRAAVSNNLFYLVVQVPLMIFSATILAVLINSKLIRFQEFFRIGYFMPSITALVAYSLVFRLILNTDYGFLNFALNTLGLPSIDWLNNPVTAKLSIVMGQTWRWTGYNMVILLAGLQGISEGIYEAADIDGAGALDKFFRVTLPLLRPIILFCFVTSTIGSLRLFDESYVLTYGGPDNATLTISHYLYNTAFRFMKFGYASAISYVLVIVTVALSALEFWISGRDDYLD
jgi:lactose/L-arabinose transport system permease protein